MTSATCHQRRQLPSHTGANIAAASDEEAGHVGIVHRDPGVGEQHPFGEREGGREEAHAPAPEQEPRQEVDADRGEGAHEHAGHPVSERVATHIHARHPTIVREGKDLGPIDARPIGLGVDRPC